MTAFYPITNQATVPSDGYFEIPGNFTSMFVPGFEFVAVLRLSGSPISSSSEGFVVLSTAYVNGKTQITPNLTGSPSQLDTGSPIGTVGTWVTLVGGAYSLDYSDSNVSPILVPVAELNRDTSLVLPGRATLNYGEYILENFLHLLENFASPNTGSPPGPINPILGQLWFEKDSATLKLYSDGSPSTWENILTEDTGVPFDEIILGGSPPTNVVNTTVKTTAKTSTRSYQQVFRNGVLQREGSTGSYTVTGPNQITFNGSPTPLGSGDEILIYQL